MLNKLRKFLKPKNIELALIFGLLFFSLLHFLFALRTDNFFSVDDFAVLAYIKDKNLFEIIRHFFLHGDIFGFGKVVGYIVFKLLFDLFGVNAFYFNFAFFILHSTNLILLYLVCKKISGNMYASAFSTLLFNKFYLFYFSNIHEVMAVLFFLSAVYVWLYHKKMYRSIVLFVMALLSKEVAFITPFVISLSAIVRKEFDWRKVFPFFIILAAYGLYELPFYLKKASLPTPDSYKILVTPQAFVEGLTFYLPPLALTFLLLLPLYSRKYRTYWILLCVIFALLPVMFLVHRREMYYFYLPASIVAIFLADNLPKLNLRNSILYLLMFFVFGGRSILPKIAWHRYPNWQKVSIMDVVNRVEEEVGKGDKEIYIGDITLERDAKLVIQNDLIGLFSGSWGLYNYNFNYNPDKKVVKIER